MSGIAGGTQYGAYSGGDSKYDSYNNKNYGGKPSQNKSYGNDNIGGMGLYGTTDVAIMHPPNLNSQLAP